MSNCTYELTHPQKRIWYIEQIYPGTSLYNIGGICKMKGDVNFSVLKQAIHAFIAKNSGVRLRIIQKGDKVLQYIAEYEYIKIDYFDFSDNVNAEKEFEEWVDHVARKPFRLYNNNLFYFAMFRISDEYNGYLVKFHHIICDGWSVNILSEDICNNYMKILNGNEVNTQPDNSYVKYIKLEQDYLSSSRFLKNKLFWNDKFAELPEAFLHKSSDFIKGRRKSYEFSIKFSMKIKEFVNRNKFSLNAFFTALYLLYLNKITGQDDLVVGIPVLNRFGRRERSIFGMFTSTMPFRFRFDTDDSIASYLQKVNYKLNNCYMNQKYPYDLLVGDLKLKKKGYDNLFNVCINYYNTRLKTDLTGLKLSNQEFYNGNQIYSLQIVVKDWSDEGNIFLDFDYKVNDYNDVDIDAMYKILSDLADKFITDPSAKTINVSLLADKTAERMLYDFNARKADYPREKAIHHLFEEQVARTPNKTAVIYKNREYTYTEVNARANSLAHQLVRDGVCPETITGIFTTHSIETVISILAVLKAGGAYLPIDMGYPAERISYMLCNSNVNVLLVNCRLPERVCFSGKIINLTDSSYYTGRTENPESSVKPTDLAYVIYTSGSTGRPKGSMIEHRGLVNYIWWAKQIYVDGDDEVFPLYSSLAFDLTVTSLFTPLICGQKMIIYTDDEDEYVLYRIISDNIATVVKLTPAHLSLLKDLDNSNSRVRRFIVGGEDLRTSLARDIEKSFGGNIKIYNEYGPTETVVGCMIHEFNVVRDKRASVPIGVPVHNVQIYILDKNFNPVPVGVAGEIYISGDGVARGYHNRPELTDQRFIANPFIPDTCMFKTGDLGRFIDENTIEYCGRVDSQVKIRGYRIELGEIEKNLLDHPCINEAVVIDREDDNQDKFLCAYIVKKSDISIHELRDFLLQTLPNYMVPLFFVELTSIPLTISGKVNRELLPAPEKNRVNAKVPGEYKTDNEEKLVKAIMQVLQVESISSDDNFLHMGGDSIKAIQISSRLKEHGLKIKVKDILSHPRIGEMVLCIQKDLDILNNQEQATGNFKPTPIICWFFRQNFPESGYYTQSVLLELKQDIDIKKMNSVLGAIINHHDSLRINWNSDTGEFYYNNCYKKSTDILVVCNLSSYSYPEQLTEMQQKGEELKAAFLLESGLLFKACLFILGCSGARLLLAAHHIVIDAVSWRIILEDIYRLYTSGAGENNQKLPLKTDSFRNWCLALDDVADNMTDNEKEYWQTAAGTECSLRTDYDLGDDTISVCHTARMQLPQNETEHLLTVANKAYNTKAEDLLITSLAVTLRNFTEKDEIVIELEGHGRQVELNGINISRTVGWFTAMYPVVFNIESNDLQKQITSVKETLRKIPGNGIGFGVGRYTGKCLRDTMYRLVRFNFLGSFDEFDDNDLFRISDEESGSDISGKNHLTCLLDINAFVKGKCLEISLTYSRNKFKDTVMKDFLLRWQTNLKDIIRHCASRQQTEFTPSDFDTLDLSQDELDLLFK